MKSISLHPKNIAIIVIALLGIVAGTVTMTKQYFTEKTTYVDPCTLPNVDCFPPVPSVSSTVPEPMPIPTSTIETVPTTTMISIEEYRRLDAINNPAPESRPFESVVIPVAWQKPVRAKLDDLPIQHFSTQDKQYFVDHITKGPYLRGRVTDGPAKGSLIYTLEIGEEGMIYYLTTYTYLVTPNGEAFNFTDHWNVEPQTGERNVSFTDTLNLPTTNVQGVELVYSLSRPTLPEVLTLTNGKQISPNADFDGYARSAAGTPNCWKNVCDGYDVVATTREGYSILKERTEKSDIKYVITEDGVRHVVYATLPADSAMTNSYRGFVLTNRSLIWDDKYQNTDIYTRFYTGGCGGRVYENVLTNKEAVSKDLIVIGHASSGDPLYGVKNYASHPESMKAYDNWFVFDKDGEKPSFEDFLKRYPVPFFIWKNAFGENIRFVLGDSVAPGECGKPVIYLYPKKTTDVSVKLGSSINVTVSEPTYPSNGWKARATPSGELTVDGKAYGSLFWEGTGVAYDVPTEGFIIKDGEVDARLKQILAQYGLNERESYEFREFWVPHMVGAPYYRASFVTTKDWNKAAPLSVQPAPETVIRIFMDWEKVQKFSALKEPVITTPKREGFTLVEWGGILRP